MLEADLEARVAWARASILVTLDPNCIDDMNSDHHHELQQHSGHATSLIKDAAKLAPFGSRVPTMIEDIPELTYVWQLHNHILRRL